jgi:hypothetical protein
MLYKVNNMVEPKIEEKKPKPQPEPKPQPQQNPTPEPKPMATPQTQSQATDAEKFYQALLNSLKSLHVSDFAAYKVKDGLTIIPVDDLGRPLLDSTLYFSGELLDKLQELIEKIGGE